MSTSRRIPLIVLLTAAAGLFCIGPEPGLSVPSVSPAAQSGSIETIEGFRAEALGNTRNLYVYLPPGYDPRGAAGIPCSMCRTARGSSIPPNGRVSP